MSKKISTVLIESQKTRTQIKGSLVKFNDYDEAESYCALGALACDMGLIKYGEKYPEYMEIIAAYGINPFSRVKNPSASTDDSMHSLYSIIIGLNDGAGWSFDKIGKWIESLETKGLLCPMPKDINWKLTVPFMDELINQANIYSKTL